MDESKWPTGFVPEPDLQGLQPLSYEEEGSKHSKTLKSNIPMNRQAAKREENNGRVKESGILGPGPRVFGPIREGPLSRRRVRINLENGN